MTEFVCRHFARIFRLAAVCVCTVAFAAVPAMPNGDSIHAAFDTLLRKNVRNGLVHYRGFDVPEFRGYVQQLAEARPEDRPRNEALAFWLNAYNAVCIATVLQHPGLESPLKVEGFFDTAHFKVAGRKLSLNEIENQVIRPVFKEPLIHFGLVCAAKGCPQLPARAFSAGNVVAMLRENIRAYLATAAGAALDRKSNTLKLSKIFSWYKEDFGSSDAELMDFAIAYMDRSEADFVQSNRASMKLDFLEYDWSLNRQ